MNALQAVAVVALGAGGLVCIASALPASRRVPLARRLRPYLGALGPRRSVLLDDRGGPSGVVLVTIGPLVDALGDRIQRLLGDHAGLRDRLAAAGRGDTPARFRSAQAIKRPSILTSPLSARAPRPGRWWRATPTAPDRRPR